MRRREQSKHERTAGACCSGSPWWAQDFCSPGGLAFAASDTIVGQVDSTYNAASYTADQGEVVPFQVTGDQPQRDCQPRTAPMARPSSVAPRSPAALSASRAPST